ncbi:MAG: hypothetical protein F4X66_17740 [Chloroflexi bacterium]|nr:hypothetical protein [Chloroflexota bacterium]
MALALLAFVYSALLFELTNHEFLVAAFLQLAAVFLALAIAYFFFEHHNITRQSRIGQTFFVATSIVKGRVMMFCPVLVEHWLAAQGRDLESPSVVPKLGFDGRFERARNYIADRGLGLDFYASPEETYESLYWIFRLFVWIADSCKEVVGSHGFVLAENGALLLAIQAYIDEVEREEKVWEAFRANNDIVQSTLPAEAVYNLFGIAHLAIKITEIADEISLPKPSDDVLRGFAEETHMRKTGPGWEEPRF